MESLPKPKKELSSRVFHIVQYLNHPTTGEILLTEETVKAALAKYKSISEWAYIIHDRDIKDDGSIKPPHFHIVLRIPRSPTSVKNVASWFGIAQNYVDVPKGRGAFYDCIMYLTHEFNPDKTRYIDEAVQANFDWKTAVSEYLTQKEKSFKRGSRNERVDEWLELLNKGDVNLTDLRNEDPVLYFRNFPVLNRTRNAYLRTIPAPACRINLLITGNAGYGKSLASRALARSFYKAEKLEDAEIFFEVGDGKVSFEGYQGQPVIIWNDSRPQTLLQMLGSRDNLFNVFDCYPSNRRQNVKYDSIALNNRYNIINTVMPWEDFIRGLAGEYTTWDGRAFHSEDVTQSYRRFPAIIPLQPEYYDVLLNNGWLTADGDYREYIEHCRIRGNFGALRRRLKEAGFSEHTVIALGEKYDEKLAGPTVQVIKDKIEATANGKEVDLSSPEAIQQILKEMMPETFSDDDPDEEYPELKGLI